MPLPWSMPWATSAASSPWTILAAGYLRLGGFLLGPGLARLAWIELHQGADVVGQVGQGVAHLADGGVTKQTFGVALLQADEVGDQEGYPPDHGDACN